MAGIIHCSVADPDLITLDESNEVVAVGNNDSISPVCQLLDLWKKNIKDKPFRNSVTSMATPYSDVDYNNNNNNNNNINNNNNNNNDSLMCEDFIVPVNGWEKVNNLLRTSNYYTASEITFYKSELITDLRVHPQEFIVISLETAQEIGNIICKLIKDNSQRENIINHLTDQVSESNSQFSSQKYDQLNELLNNKDAIINQLRDAIADLNCENERIKSFNEHNIFIQGDCVNDKSETLQELENCRSRIAELELMVSQSPESYCNRYYPFQQTQQVSNSDTYNKNTTNKYGFNRGKFKLVNKQSEFDSPLHLSSEEAVEKLETLIQILCSEAEVDSIEDLYSYIKQSKIAPLHQDTRLINNMTDIMNNALIPPRFRPNSYDDNANIIQLINLWSDELCNLRELQYTVYQITEGANLAINSHNPNKLHNFSKDYQEWSISEISFCLKSAFLASKSKRNLTPDILEGLVSHFATLFNSRDPVYMFTHMNLIQCKLEEMENILKSCKISLGLSVSSSNSALINTLQAILSDTKLQEHNNQDIKLSWVKYDSIELIERVKFYEQFFFHFEWVVTKLFNLLNISKLSQIIPKIESLVTLININE